MSETIRRDAAIETAKRMYAVCDTNSIDDYAMLMEEALKVLPSAEPQIIRCKDCKHWIPYDWMFSEVWQSKNIADYPEDEIGCALSDMVMKASDFCSRAERREVEDAEAKI